METLSADRGIGRYLFFMLELQVVLEIFGYIGSFLVVFSMLMSSVVKLRILNTIGSVISGTYALICGAYPLVLMNGCIILINLYGLYKLLKTQQQYDMVESKKDDSLLKYFVERYQGDIKKYFPDFVCEAEYEKAYVVCCNGNPAGILLGNEKEAGVFDVLVDYSTPAYRDCSVGTYLYSKLPLHGINVLEFGKEEAPEHVSYLKKMGFKKAGSTYVRKLK